MARFELLFLPEFLKHEGADQAALIESLFLVPADA